MPKGKTKASKNKASKSSSPNNEEPAQQAEDQRPQSPLLPPNTSEYQIKDALISLYHYGILNMLSRSFMDAYRAFDAIIPLAATDPLLWMRKAEAILAHANKKEQIYSHLPGNLRYTPQSYNRHLHEPSGMPESESVKQMRATLVSYKLDPYEFLDVHYADTCLRTSLSLLHGSDNIYEEKFATATYAFLQLRFGLFHRAKVNARKCIEFPAEYDKSNFKPRFFNFVDSIMTAAIFREMVFSPVMSFMDEFIEYPVPNEPTDSNDAEVRWLIKYAANENFDEAKKKVVMLFEKDFNRELIALGAYVYLKLGNIDEFRQMILARYPEINREDIEIPPPIHNGFATEIGFADYWNSAIQIHFDDMTVRMDEARAYLDEKLSQENAEEARVLAIQEARLLAQLEALRQNEAEQQARNHVGMNPEAIRRAQELSVPNVEDFHFESTGVAVDPEFTAAIQNLSDPEPRVEEAAALATEVRNAIADLQIS